MIKWMINYTPLGWPLNAGEPCLREHDTNSDTDFWRLGTGALFMRSIAGKFTHQCFSCMGARRGGHGAALPVALTNSCGREGGRGRPKGEAFLGRVHFSHPFRWVFGHAGWANQQPYKPGKVEVLSHIAWAPHGHLPPLSCPSLWLLIWAK